MTNEQSAEAVTARKCWRTLEPFHGMIYFVPEAAEEYSAIGVDGRAGYFGSRSAAMGPVAADVVRATFYNFHPDLVHRAMDGLWDHVTADEMLLARHRAVDSSLRRLLGDEVDNPDLAVAVDLVRPAVQAAIARPEGRPLFAGHARLPEPDMPHLALWWAVTLLREFRGDGHVAALVDAGLSGVEALIMHGATGQVPMEVLKSTRSWSDVEWHEALESLRHRGLVEDDTLTTAGVELRDRVEERTDAMATTAWAAIDEDDAERLRVLVRPWSKSISQQAFA